MNRVCWLLAALVPACWAAGVGPIRQGRLPTASAGEAPAGSGQEAEDARLFEDRIAPILEQHCLDCHNPQDRKGELDLTGRQTALEGGLGGPAIVPGRLGESLLWEQVELDAMPAGRPPLSADQKQVLRDWIEAGAPWTADLTAPEGREPPAARNWLRRLTVPEYVETVRAAVGVDVDREARTLLPRDLRADGFSNTSYNLNVDLGHVEAYARLARIAADRMDVEAFADRFASRRDPGDDAMRGLISGMGAWLLRGPLEAGEVDTYLEISRAVADSGGDFDEAVRLLVEAMLQSPRFLYLVEHQRGDGSLKALDGFELASRMSYIVWGGPPDEELYRAADRGELLDRRGVRRQVLRMLEDPRAIDRSCRFVEEWLNLGRLENLRPDPGRYPAWDARLAADMRDETLAFFRHVAWERGRPLGELLDARVTFASPRLAAIYGLDWRSSRDESGGEGPLALYRFDEGEGRTIRDASGGAGEPVDLRVEDPSAVDWTGDGLAIRKPTTITAIGPSNRLTRAIRESGAFSLEAWITPEDDDQDGPARIVSLSSGSSRRNVTIGQDGDRFEVRFRSERTDANGLPGVSSPPGSAGPRLSHVAYTRDRSGKARIFVDGEAVGSANVGGELSNWDDSFRLVLGNETSGDRPWRGVLHRVSLHDRALTAGEIRGLARGRARFDLASTPARGGLLTQGSVLTIGGDESSMVARGLFVLHDVLGGEVGDPPPGVDTTPVPPEPGLSQRSIALGRIQNPSCGGCHSRFEPLAFGLERFDGIGAYREVDHHGNTLRDDGDILIPGRRGAISYDSSPELMRLLARSERVEETIARKIIQFALGRPLVPADEPGLDEILDEAREGGLTYARLITSLVSSDLVRMTHTEPSR